MRKNKGIINMGIIIELPFKGIEKVILKPLENSVNIVQRHRPMFNVCSRIMNYQKIIPWSTHSTIGKLLEAYVSGPINRDVIYINKRRQWVYQFKKKMLLR
jgi:hypothetical protein